MKGDVCVIVNPASGRGRGAQTLPKLREAFAAVGVSDIRVTAAQHDEAAFARRAIADGRTTIVAVGGDGTISNIANAIIASGSDARLGMIAAGTGNDFYKTVGAPARDIPATAQLAVDGPDLRVDVGRIEDKHFLNVTGFGFDMAVLEDVQTIGWLSGPLLYNYSALRQLLFYKGVGIDMASAAGPRRNAHHLMLIIANCRHFGGTFRIAPDALLNDGKLDAVSFHDATPLRRLRLFAAAIAGTHPMQPEVQVERSERFTLRFAQPPAYEIDGEYNRASSTELEVRCVPRAIRVVTPGSAAAR
jgi:diacylglycerol kinase (ATP)